MIEDLLKLFENLIKPRFKIAIISYYYPYQKPSTSGVGTHVYNLVTTLAKLGCEVHVFSYSDKDSTKKIKVGNGKIIIHFINSNFKFAVSNPIIEKRVKYAIFENKILNEFIYEHSRRHFKIIHTHGWLTSSAFMLKHLYNIPWVHTIHALERNRLIHMTEEEKQLYRLTSWIEDTLSDADRLICVSKSVQKEVLKSFNNISKKTIVIPNAVDLKIFVPGEKKSRTVLTISRFSKEKGSFLLPEIIENVLSKTKDSKFIAIIQ
jgi:glycosyltransferase involved in cell wall biosynthesis